MKMRAWLHKIAEAVVRGLYPRVKGLHRTHPVRPSEAPFWPFLGGPDSE